MNMLVGRLGPWIGGAIVLIALPHVFSSGFALTLMSQIGLLIVFALAYNMLLGQGGMLSFGHAVYFGLAGYFTIHYLNFIYEEEVPYIPVTLIPLLGGLVGLFFGILIGYVSTRRAGTTFAMISLGFGEMVTALTLVLVAIFNGEDGIQTDRVIGEELFGVTYGPNIEVYYLIAGWCLLCTLAMFLLTRTPFGRISNAVRDNAERVEFIGYSSQRIRWLAFSLSSFFAGIAGALHAVNIEHVGFEQVSVLQSGLVLFMVYIGGTGSFVGPIIGATLLYFLQSTLTGVTEAWVLYLGVMFVAVIMFFPGGLAGLITMHQPIWRVHSRLLAPLLIPYARFFAALVASVLGCIGLIEMLYFRSSRLSTETELIIFGIESDPFSAVPWVVFTGIAVAGGFAVRKTLPSAVSAWNTAIADARALPRG
ncbi:MAG: branched-chain amino acid ABC transporter permease [Rhodospirillales bacterium]|nr:branched-chain amino acid ABC transporter permease [Rhodospirillales bacterium]MCY4004327.1 branched-chain amino acid ABC transporter permease [Rhodospirillales bacterium]